jgi:hypothetical protein
MDEYVALSELPGAVYGAQLQPAATATTVRVDDGETLTTHGPAARIGGRIEVRPLVER